jgi:hypothetical protein
MSYAIFQTQLEKPPREALKVALGAIRGFAAADADILVNDAYGILTGGLTLEQAQALCAALGREGVATEVVDEGLIVRLPPSRQAKRIDCLREHLLIYDALERVSAVPWGQVRLVAAGWVVLSEWERKENKRRVTGATQREDEQAFERTDITTRELNRTRPVLDIILDVSPGRIELLGHECLYNYLGDRLTARPSDNFPLLVKDLATFAERAVLNRGAANLGSDAAEAFRYPTRHAFEEEIVWLMWSAMGVRRVR